MVDTEVDDPLVRTIVGSSGEDVRRTGSPYELQRYADRVIQKTDYPRWQLITSASLLTLVNQETLYSVNHPIMLNPSG
jgi:hypothetical protein